MRCMVHAPNECIAAHARHICTNKMTPAGLEPAIPASVGRCLIHWATGPDAFDLLGAHYTERLERRVNLIHPNALYGMELGRQATNMHSVSSVVSFVYTAAFGKQPSRQGHWKSRAYTFHPIVIVRAPYCTGAVRETTETRIIYTDVKLIVGFSSGLQK